MELDQINALISEKTGVPAVLLDGKTAEENIAKARAVLEYRREAGTDQERKRSTKEQFAVWLNSEFQDPDPAAAELDRIAEDLRIANGGYPQMEDGGELDPSPSGFPDTRPTSVQFAEWFRQETAYNPRKVNGWIPLE